MSIYMSQFAYTSDSWATLTQNPEDRSAAVSTLAEAMGGRVICFYHSFGDYDGIVIYEAPDEGAAAAIPLAAASTGHLKTIKTTLLLTVEDAMEAMRKAGEATFRRPGQQ